MNLGSKEAGYYVTRDKAARWDGRNYCGEKIARLDIPELWKFYCNLFAQKTNPHYSEVREMIFQLTPDDMIMAIESVPAEDVPEALDKILSRVPEEQRVRTIDMILPHIPEEQRVRTIDMILPHISEEQRVRTIGVILPRIPEERRIEVFNIFTSQVPEDKLKEWAREILDGRK